MERKLHSNVSIDDVSVQKLVIALFRAKDFLGKRIKILFVAAILGSVLGFVYASFIPKKFTAKTTFVVQEGKPSSGGGLASLAGQFGFDLGGSGNGLFSEDNILIFLKSESLIRETFLTKVDSLSNNSLADLFVANSPFKSKWEKKGFGSVDFSKFNSIQLPRVEDSLLQVLVKDFNARNLVIGKVDKKSSFVEIKVISNSEKFSYLFVRRLIKLASEKYIELKTKVKVANILKLQRRADSLSAVLNNKTYSAASSQQQLLDANPALRQMPVVTEISARDKTLVASIFAEVVKNLELSKTILSQETPVVQIVDQSTLPLPIESISKISYSLFSGIALFIISVLVLVFGRLFKSFKSLNVAIKNEKHVQ
jgi:hypothetical protein